jgi:hypothetical protein
LLLSRRFTAKIVHQQVKQYSMKKFLLLMMVLTLTAMSAAARPKTSSLTIKGNNNELVSVAIGNLPFSEAAPEVTIKNLQKGKHYIRVMRHHRGLFR